MTVQIVTPRLTLRPLVIEDTTALLPLFNDWAVIEWLSAPPWPYTDADMRSYFGAQLFRGAAGIDSAGSGGAIRHREQW
jgi:RimJ/RimL family protein N-acetyltransferase